MKLKFHKNFLFKYSRKLSSFPANIKKKHIYIVPTSAGFIFLLVNFVIFIGSVNENNNMGLLFSFFLFSIFTTALWHTRKNILNLRINSIRIENTFAQTDSKLTFFISCENQTRQMIFIKTNAQEINIPSIKPKTPVQAKVVLKASKRGIYTFNKAVLFSVFPFGIFKAWTNIIITNEQVIYPKPSNKGIDIIQLKNMDSSSTKKQKFEQENFKGLREYVHGDSIKRISWKSYSKGLGVYVKDFENNSVKDNITIFWNKIPISDTEKRLCIICRTIIDLEAMNINYGIDLPDFKILPSKGERHKTKCLKALAEFNNEQLNKKR